MLLNVLSRNWWLVLLRGIAAIAFGLLAFAWPGLTLLALVVLYGIFALSDGLLALFAAISGSAAVSRWWLLAVGIAGIAAGVITLLWPGLTAVLLIMFIGGWAIVVGISEIAGAIELRKEIDNEWLLIATGLLSVLFGVVVILAPGAGAVALAWVIGSYSIVAGVLLVALSLRLRKHLRAAVL
jgi:uncharacterized membrane protein HdeD (DUF308 family)